MGKYLDLLENMSISEYNVSFTPVNDTLTDAFSISREETNGWIEYGVIFFFWFILFIHISKVENNFGLSIVQSIISINTLIFCLTLMLLYIGFIVNIKLFMWTMLLVFFAQIWGIFRTSTN